MSNLKILEEKINALKVKTRETISSLIKEVDDYNNSIGKTDLIEVYTEENAPDNVKKLPAKKKRQWIAIWNSVYKQTKSEVRAFKAANAILKESGSEIDFLLGTPTKKEIMQKLLDEIDSFMNRINDGIKNKTGSPAIRSFLREVKSKMKNILGNIKESELRESAQRIIDSITKIEEGAPQGSFEAIRDKVQEALRATILFVDPNDLDRKPWIRYLFTDKVIVEFKSKNYMLSYAIDTNNIVKFGNPVEVAEEFVVKEGESSLAEFKNTSESEIKESSITNKGRASNLDLDVGFVSLKESVFNKDTGEINVILIEAGTNELKKRHYPVRTIVEAAPLFAGLKMYINHPTKVEDRERPERNLMDWASTIIESRAIDGKAVAKVSVHDQWLRERLENKTFRENVGLSINAGGLVSYGKVNGKDMQIVEKITLNRRNGPASVDWVTEAGARGRVASELFESRRSGKMLDLQTVSLAEVLRERPDLIKELKESITNELKESKEAKEKETQLQEALKKIELFEKKELENKHTTLVEGWLKEKKVNEVLHERIVESLKGKDFKNETELKEAFDAVVKKEVEFLNKIGGKGKIKLAESSEEGNESLLESLGKDLDERAGFKEEEEKKEGEE